MIFIYLMRVKFTTRPWIWLVVPSWSLKFQNALLNLQICQPRVHYFFNCKVEIFFVMLTLYVGPNFVLLLVCAQLLYFLNFLQKNYFKNLCPNIFLMFSSKIYTFLLSDFVYNRCHMSFVLYNFLYNLFIFEHIFTSNMNFSCIYFVSEQII